MTKANTLNKIKKVFCEVLKIKNITLKSKINKTSGWDSINHLRIIIEIEKSFGIQFSANQITNIQCIEDILEILNNKKTKG